MALLLAAVALPQPPSFRDLQRQLPLQPEVVLQAVLARRTSPLQQQLLQHSYLLLAAREPALAATYTARLLGQPWLSQLPFLHAMEQAQALSPAQAETLLLQVARAQPEVALRNAHRLGPYVRPVLSAAIEEEPGLAVGLAEKPEAAGTPLPELVALMLGPSALSPHYSLLLRIRWANLYRPPHPASPPPDEALADPAIYFRLLASAVMASAQTSSPQQLPMENASIAARSLRQARLLRHAEQASRELFSAIADARQANPSQVQPLLSSLDPPALLLLASFAEQESELDLLPQLLRRVPEPAAAENFPADRLRALLRNATRRGQFARFAKQSVLLANSLRNLDGPVNAAIVAEYLPWIPALAAEKQPAHQVLAAQGKLGELLLALLPGNAASALRPARLALPLPIVERIIFPDDQDGVESFASFRAAWKGDRAWIWQQQEGVVTLTPRHQSHRITIIANVPENLSAEGVEPFAKEAAAVRDARVQTALPALPSIVVVRGHDFHVSNAVRHLPASAALVVLGSCRGTQAILDVASAAPAAQLVATRSTGSKRVNDPLLKALHTQLLRSSQTTPRVAVVDWAGLWAELRASLGPANQLFRDYVPPPQNNPALFLRAYAAWAEREFDSGR